MADVIVESDEEEFDETNSQLISEKKKHPYIRQTRDLSTKPKKQKHGCTKPPMSATSPLQLPENSFGMPKSKRLVEKTSFA